MPAVHVAPATSYCLQGKTASGKQVSKRTAAHNFLFSPFRDVKIRIVGPQPGPGGIRRYIIRDTGPALADGHFDLWSSSCSRSIQFGRRMIKWKMGWRKK
jgi:3D (Asp-Asp-Asp) domain-containing protein